MSIKCNILPVNDIVYGPDHKGAVFIYKYEPLSNSWNNSGDTFMNDGRSYFFGSFVRLTYNGELLVGCEGGVY